MVCDLSMQTGFGGGLGVGRRDEEVEDRREVVVEWTGVVVERA